MPITVLENDRGFQWGMDYANQVYNRIQDFAKHQQQQSADLMKHRSTMAVHKLNATMPLIESMLRSPDEKTKQAGRDAYAGIANEIDGGIMEERGATSRDYLDAYNTDWLPGDKAVGKYTAPNQYYKTLGTSAPQSNIAKQITTPRANGTGIPMNNIPPYEQPLPQRRNGNIFDDMIQNIANRYNQPTTPDAAQPQSESDINDILYNPWGE